MIKSDISNGVRRCYVVLTLERCYKYMVTFTKQFSFSVDFFSAMAESSKKLKSSNVFSLFILCSNRNRSALMRELLSNNSLFVGQLYEDKSLALRARYLIFFLQLTSKQ